jgi:predicted DNA-binding protein (UPF0251 family)
MTLDEFEALRLADLEGRYQEAAAAEMHISRPTFSRIIESARKKLADALVNGRAIRIEGGPVCPRNEGGSCCRIAGSQPQEASSEPKPRRKKA